MNFQHGNGRIAGKYFSMTETALNIHGQHSLYAGEYPNDQLVVDINAEIQRVLADGLAIDHILMPAALISHLFSIGKVRMVRMAALGSEHEGFAFTRNGEIQEMHVVAFPVELYPTTLLVFVVPDLEYDAINLHNNPFQVVTQHRTTTNFG